MKYRYFIAFIENGSIRSVILDCNLTKEQLISHLIKEDKVPLNCIQLN